ncbi:carboxylating nicotinate-nucleotide diphosphorylase [Oceanirhabdus seepicola]|uniref:Probable nicotinate-nucleotide pyrophosphorylase [carboxylating] n=1 Tax=Oceanirhabdus seepicola TaxID=2828781 RepID=A0A9J6P0L4_9CLOT|nr:carboxylating nicotinate-nucleotide diphosphorylase [Oceanirhabdus seepicola]MCM1988992.1 carboxylating nicotinate-nucleotide diphosphorylase [Oceanirhabdus seepicola]
MNYVIIDDLIQSALVEDLYYGDITTESLIEEDSTCTVDLIAKEKGILAGRDVFNAVFKKLGEVEINWTKKDGDHLENGQVIAKINGNTRNILTGERIALNLLQRMSGIATITNSMVRLTEGTSTRIVCTRKTTPTFRILEKYAVKAGGGVNHRFSLSDSFMIKDNHIKACAGIKEAVKKAKESYPYLRAIEVEVESLEEVKEALDTEANVIMLDNMTTEDMTEAVNLINGEKITEASGNMTIDRIKEVASTGVDFISCGALTHSVKALDVSMKNLRIIE